MLSVPRDRLYHPVKCEAERQWEGKSLVDKAAPQLSLLAPELSGGKGFSFGWFGSTGGHEDRDRLQGMRPKAITRKDTARGDLLETETARQFKKMYQKSASRWEDSLSEKRARDALQGEGGAVRYGISPTQGECVTL